MKHWKAIGVASVAVLAATATVVPVWRHPSRGVRLLEQPAVTAPGRFDPKQSAALFIGVRKFAYDKTAEVPFAADDAVDLAYAFALDRRIALVPPERVVIALSGRPQKAESQARLKELCDAGAKLRDAGPGDILTLLQQQSAQAGKDGMLIVSVATHGFVEAGVPYILGSSSVFRYSETALPMPKLFDIASKSEASRSVFFIDTCRERLTKDARAVASPATGAPLLSRIGRVRGQVVFYAAPANGFAYDADGNGVFTKAVLEALDCKATLVRGAVTIGTLRSFVEHTVRKWIRQHREPNLGAATQISIDGDSHTMPLCQCGPPPPPIVGNVSRATFGGKTVNAFDANGSSMWSREMDSAVTQAGAGDLNADGIREVIVTTNIVTVFDRAGARLWSADETMRLRAVRVDELLRREPGVQIVALWDDEHAPHARVAMYRASGQRLATYEHTGHLQHLTIDRPTSHHGRKIVVTGVAGDQAIVAVLESSLKPAWTDLLSPSSERITALSMLDHDNDSRRDIVLSTATGNTLYVDFTGRVIDRSSPRLTLKMLGRRGIPAHRRPLPKAP